MPPSGETNQRLVGFVSGPPNSWHGFRDANLKELILFPSIPFQRRFISPTAAGCGALESFQCLRSWASHFSFLGSLRHHLEPRRSSSHTLGSSADCAAAIHHQFLSRQPRLGTSGITCFGPAVGGFTACGCRVIPPSRYLELLGMEDGC